MNLALAAEGAEIIEALADWDAVMGAAESQHAAQIKAREIIGDRWKEFVEFEWIFDCGPTLTKVYRGEGTPSRTQ